MVEASQPESTKQKTYRVEVTDEELQKLQLTGFRIQAIQLFHESLHHKLFHVYVHLALLCTLAEQRSAELVWGIDRSSESLPRRPQTVVK